MKAFTLSLCSSILCRPDLEGILENLGVYLQNSTITHHLWGAYLKNRTEKYTFLQGEHLAVVKNNLIIPMPSHPSDQRSYGHQTCGEISCGEQNE